MCSYCGHVSKRPVLDIPGPPAIIDDLVLGCGQDWQTDGAAGNWRYPHDRCLTERSCSDAAIFVCRIASGLLLCLRWIGTHILKIGSFAGDSAADADGHGSGRRSEGEGSCPERRSEKARRKSEEKRRARLEREMLEEEERKQREEVARLIEEQRKLRDDSSEVKKEDGSVSARDASKKETEKKRPERRRDMDKGSSKSNSDGEASGEVGRKRDSDRKNENDRCIDVHKSGLESSKSTSETAAQGAKSLAGKSRYFDRVKGSFLSSSKGFAGANFFGKPSKNNSATTGKSNKPSAGPGEPVNNLPRKEVPPVADQSGRPALNGGDSTVAASHKQHAISTPPPANVWKKSWHQLFTCSSPSDTSLDNNTTALNMNDGTLQSSPRYAVGNQMQIGQPFSYTSYPQMNDSSVNICSHFPAPTSSYPFDGAMSHNTIGEEAELFEDPCYVPDHISLIGPISKPLDNFPMNIGTGTASDTKLENSVLFRKSSASADVSKPSPIESPLTRSRLSEQRVGHPGQCLGTAKTLDSSSSSHSGPIVTATHEPGIWHMWDTPLAQESLSIIGASANRILPIGKNKVNQEDTVYSLANDNTMNQIPDVNFAQFGMLPTLNKFVDRPLNDSSPVLIENGLDKSDQWIENSVLQPLFIDDADQQFPPLKLQDDISPTKAIYQNPVRLEASQGFDLPSPDCWSKGDWPVPGPCEFGNGPSPRTDMGGLFPSQTDVQPVWAFKQKMEAEQHK